MQVAVESSSIVAVCGDQLFRIEAATGRVIAKTPLERKPGTEAALLQYGSLTEIGEAMVAVPRAEPDPAQGNLRPPLVETWRLACDTPELVWPGPATERADIFGVLSGQSVLCVRVQPNAEVVWQRRLRERPDSMGFHGRLMVAAQGRTLTALAVQDGTTKWALELPFPADVVCGDEQILVAAELSSRGKVAAIDPGLGKILWTRWFGQEIRFNTRTLKWVTLQAEPGERPVLHLYWNHAILSGKKEWQPIEAIADAASGIVRDVRLFLPDEPIWPRAIAFGDDVRVRPDAGRGPAPWPRQGPFLPDAIAYVGKESRAHVMARTAGVDLTPSWNQVLDVDPVSLHPTASGTYIRHADHLVHFAGAASTGVVYRLPPGRAGEILDFCEGTGRVMVVSGPLPAGPENKGTSNAPPALTGLRVDVFQRDAAAGLQGDMLPGDRPKAAAGYQSEARILDRAIIATDPGGIRVYRSTPPE
jgi:hypothetical protein